MLGGVVFGHDQSKIAIAAINELVRDAGKPAWDWAAPAKDEAFIGKITALAEEKLRAAYQIRNKQTRTQALRETTASVTEALKELASCDGLCFEGARLRLRDLAHRVTSSDSQAQLRTVWMSPIVARETMNRSARFRRDSIPLKERISRASGSVSFAVPHRSPRLCVPWSSLSAAFSTGVFHSRCSGAMQPSWPFPQE
jgi:hypothetical protein